MDMTQQRMFVTPAEFPSPDCRGFLLKLDASSKSWKRRYCILVDSSLILYTDFDAPSASGKITMLKLVFLMVLYFSWLCNNNFLTFMNQTYFCLATICLHGYRVQSTGGLSGSKRHAFELIPPDYPQGLNFFYFVAETETERKR